MLYEDPKPASKSLTIWGAIATLAVAASSIAGIDLDAGMVTEAVQGIATVVATAMTIWGRLRATKAIQK